MDDNDDDGGLHVEVCKQCLRHAHFSYRGDPISAEFFSQTEAKIIAEEYYKEGDISGWMLDRIRTDIQRSGLPADIPHEMKYLLELDNKLNALFYKATFPESDPRLTLAPPDEEEFMEDLHSFLETFFPERPATYQ